MKIEFECSGGFANLRLSYRADTENLPADLADDLRRLVVDSGILDLDPKDVSPKSAGPPDIFSYKLSLHEGGKRKILSFNDVTIPVSAQPLLARLRELALKERKSK